VVESGLQGNSTSSANSSGPNTAPIPDGGGAIVLAVSAGGSDVVNLSGLRDEALVARIIKKAPLVLGFNAARYDCKFFEDVAGLCGSDLDVSEVPTSGGKIPGWKLLFPHKAGEGQASRCG
jgi:hypothetical protein